MSCRRCDCDCCGDDEYDADELGLDPELDVERRVQSLNERAARSLLRRPRYPGEIVHGEPVWGHDS